MKNYRVVYKVAVSSRHNEQTFKFESEPMSEEWAEIVLKDAQKIDSKAYIEVYLPTISIWAPVCDAEVLKKYLNNLKEFYRPCD